MTKHTTSCPSGRNHGTRIIVGHCPKCAHAIEDGYPGGVARHLANCHGRSGQDDPAAWLRQYPEHATTARLRQKLGPAGQHAIPPVRKGATAPAEPAARSSARRSRKAAA